MNYLLMADKSLMSKIYDVPNTNPEKEKFVNALNDEFNIFVDYTVGLLSRYGVLYNNYKKTYDNYNKLIAENERLKRENQSLSEEINKQRKPRKTFDLDEMYQCYIETKSFRKTGEHFGCEGKTVKSKLLAAGYLSGANKYEVGNK